MHFKQYKTILSPQNGMNIYRGCDHGCVYCDSRSKCYQMDHDFEDIEVKQNAAEILDKELSQKKKPVVIGTGAMSDPYNHVEEKLLYTRKCLEVILNHHCGIAIQTKSNLILRDIDLLDAINKDSKAVVEITLTTANDELCKKIEPNVCVTSERVKVLKKCQELGIPTVVWLCPNLPWINDDMDNMMKLMDLIIDAGVKGIVYFGVGVTLRQGDREYFYKFLDKEYPGLKHKYIKKYGYSYEITSDNNVSITNEVIRRCKENNIIYKQNELFLWMREYPKKYGQLSIFDIE